MWERLKDKITPDGKIAYIWKRQTRFLVLTTMDRKISVKEQYKHFQHVLRCYWRKWDAQGITDITAAPDFEEYENYLYGWTEYFIKFMPGKGM